MRKAIMVILSITVAVIVTSQADAKKKNDNNYATVCIYPSLRQVVSDLIKTTDWINPQAHHVGIVADERQAVADREAMSALGSKGEIPG